MRGNGNKEHSKAIELLDGFPDAERTRLHDKAQLILEALIDGNLSRAVDGVLSEIAAANVAYLTVLLLEGCDSEAKEIAVTHEIALRIGQA